MLAVRTATAAAAPRVALRAWQVHALERLATWTSGPFLISAAPGAGKTIPSLVFARRLLDAGVVRRVSYSYAAAVRDGICRPVVFIPYDGTLSWQSGDDVIESSLETVLTSREASRRYRTAISTELADGLPRILRAAHERLEEVRAGGHRDAGGLVVATDGEHARRVAAALKEVTGRLPAHPGAGGREAARFSQQPRALDRGREHGLRGGRHPAPARREADIVKPVVLGVNGGGERVRVGLA